MGRKSNKDKILEAAENLVYRKGAAHMTLDAVAEEAGVSKGGLLYHFRSKDELLQGILEQHINEAIELLSEQEKMAEENKQSILEYYLEAVDEYTKDHKKQKMGVALLAAIANNPSLLEPFDQIMEEKHRLIWGKGKTFDPESAAIWLSSEGLKFFKLFRIKIFSEEEEQQILDLIKDKAKEVQEGNK